MLSKAIFLMSFLLLLTLRSTTNDSGEESIEFWEEKAKKELRRAKEVQYLNRNRAKNVILFVGDGMGMPTVTAGRILKGQLKGQNGEEYDLAMDKFPHVGLAKTYSLDRQVSDSAATATAFLTGVKTKQGIIGLSGKATRKDCKSAKENELSTIAEEAFEKGKSVGLITTTEITDGTPAAAYAHSPERDWTNDAKMTAQDKAEGCKDIATQFCEKSDMFTVVLGGGRREFQSENTSDVEYGRMKGTRKDGRDMIREWIEDTKRGETRKFVWNKEQFDSVDPLKTDKLLGLFERAEMKYDVDRKNNEPSIADMTEKTLLMLKKNKNGYFLLVEGGRIDHGHHGNSAYEALHEMVAFDDAIERALNMTLEKDTLIVVTADHSHTMTLGGRAVRGNSVFGLAADDELTLSMDEKPYTSILYGNGPLYQEGGRGYLKLQMNPKATMVRQDLTDVDTTSRGYRQQTAVPSKMATHGGDDVPIFASGPMAHLFHGVHEQSYIAHVIRYASCLVVDKDDDDHCWAA